jgi:hypothetical protein
MTKIVTENEKQTTAIVNPAPPIRILVSSDAQNKVVVLTKKPVIVTSKESSPTVSIRQQAPDIIRTQSKQTVVQMGKTINPRVNIGTQGLTGPRGDTGAQGETGAKGDPGNFALDDFNKYKDITLQMDYSSGKNTFDVGENFVHLRVFYNGRNQNHTIVNTVGTLFTLDFVPKEGPDKKLEIYYDVP